MTHEKRKGCRYIGEVSPGTRLASYGDKVIAVDPLRGVMMVDGEPLVLRPVVRHFPPSPLMVGTKDGLISMEKIEQITALMDAAAISERRILVYKNKTYLLDE